MNIVMLTAYFLPEVGSAAHLFAEIGRELARRGHRITVLTGYPTYNVDRPKLPPKYRSGRWMKEVMNDMTVVRVKTLGMPRHIPVLRGLDQVSAAVISVFSGLFLFRGRADVILVYSPPLFLGLTALVLRWFKGAKVVLNVQDLFPQSAIDLGLLKSRPLVRIFRSVEALLYRRVDMVTVHSLGNRDHVVSHGGAPGRTLVVPNTVDTNVIVPGPRENEFRHRYDIDHQDFIVSFAGVLGYSQDLDIVIDAARMLEQLDRLIFYIVGDGVEKPRLMKKANGMKNVRFLPMLSKEEYLSLLHASDVCLVTLRSEVKTPVVPSKILSIMAAGRPVVAALPLGGDAPLLIEEAECGICVEPGSPPKLAAAIRQVFERRDLAEKFARNGRRFAEHDLSLEVCVDRYEEVFDKITN